MTYTENIKDALIAKSNAEFKRLEQKGFCMSGNGFCEILALTSIDNANQDTNKNAAETATKQAAPLLSPTAQDALEKALVRMGYPPHCWAVVAIPCSSHASNHPQAASQPSNAAHKSQSLQDMRKADEAFYRAVREICAVFSAHTVLLCTKEAVQAMRGAYATELTTLENIDAALLAPGTLATVCGMRVLNVGNLEEAFTSAQLKQRLWSWLKQLWR